MFCQQQPFLLPPFSPLPLFSPLSPPSPFLTCFCFPLYHLLFPRSHLLLFFSLSHPTFDWFFLFSPLLFLSLSCEFIFMALQFLNLKIWVCVKFWKFIQKQWFCYAPLFLHCWTLPLHLGQSNLVLCLDWHVLLSRLKKHHFSSCVILNLIRI